MIKRPGRLFWKFFVLTMLIQISSDLVVDAFRSYSPPSAVISGADHSNRQASAPERRPTGPLFPPLEQFLDDVLASLGCATLLAWLFSKPIRNLHSALADAASGNLDIRIADRMGPGDDELKDLGVGFDRMIA